jgi:hypothetical protein
MFVFKREAHETAAKQASALSIAAALESSGGVFGRLLAFSSGAAQEGEAGTS